MTDLVASRCAAGAASFEANSAEGNPPQPSESPPAPTLRPDETSGRTRLRAAVVRFRTPCSAQEFAAGDLELVPSQLVVVETDRGTRIGTVVEVLARGGAAPAHSVLRVVTDEDVQVHERNRVREREAFQFCVERIQAFALPMRLVSVELAHSGSSAVFSFTSEQRVDFRALVKDLARRFHTRIDMRQIGVRDAARLCGGLGVCGRELCCATWLPSFSPISVRMAKDQNLALNQEKLSGACGRLKCCLAFEQEAYAELHRGLPKVGKRVLTPVGPARVKDVNVLKRLVRVQYADGTYQELRADEVRRAVDVGGAPGHDLEREPGESGCTPPPISVTQSPRAEGGRPASSAEGSGQAGRASADSSPARSQGGTQPGAPGVAGRRRRRRRGRRGRGGGTGGPQGEGSSGPDGGSAGGASTR